MATESLVKFTCDNCGRVVEVPRPEEGQMPEARDLPEGWISVTVWPVQRSGDFHSKRCAAAWLVKRDRRRVKPEVAE